MRFGVLDDPIFVLTFVAALGAGLVGGVFFAFSSFVMKALRGIAPGSGMTAMQSINVVVINLSFLSVFLGTTTACVFLVLYAVWSWRAPGAECLLLGGSFYLAGTFLVTLMFNVPRNEALSRIDPAHPDAEAAWRTYAHGWTRWNHVRALAAFVASAYFIVALTQLTT